MTDGSPDYVPVPIAAFMRGLPIRVDSFIALNDDKFVMVFKAGTPVDLERLQEYREKRLKVLHVRKSDCRAFCDGQLLMAYKALGYPNLLIEQKFQFLNLAHQALTTKLETMGFNGETFEAAKLCARSVLGVVATEPKLISLLARLQVGSDRLFHHSMSVAVVSAVLGRALEWTRPDTMEKLVLGGILHDIGLKDVPAALRERPLAEMTLSQQVQYMDHVGRGVSLLSSVPAVSSDIIAIVHQHHELSNGAGYPQKLRDVKINPLARVVALADHYCDLIHSTGPDGELLSSQKAIERIEVGMGQPFNRDAFKKLKSLVLSELVAA